MIIVIKNNSERKQLDNLIRWIEGQGLRINLSKGENTTVLGLIGDTTRVDVDLLNSLDIVESVKRIQEPYKNANRKLHPEDTIIDVSGRKFGGDNFQIIAGPCSVESEKQVIGIAEAVKAAGATLLRGGAFKPRTSPYAFQGLGDAGIDILVKAKQETGLPIVTEIMGAEHLDKFVDVDIIQVGARNMQNFDLLKILGRTDKPILLKRGIAATMEEWPMHTHTIIVQTGSVKPSISSPISSHRTIR